MGIGEAVMRSAVFLDRDGVINRAFVHHGRPYPPASLRDLEVLPQVAGALSALKARGYPLIVVTNQPDVARGRISRESVESIHERLMRDLDLDAILTCFHDNADACDCRKPKPGLLFQAAHDFDIDLSSSFMVGDRWRDMEAGKRAGCRTLYIDCNYDEAQPEFCNFRVASLVEASKVILAQVDSR
jgi:D-glycero-D-manno-heptose 1,7-bisphosphate phosphatase